VAIPIINKFATTGEFIEPYLGFLHMTKTLFLTLTEMSKCKTGLCGKCGRNGPAYKSGIRVGCIMTQIDGEEISTMMQLRCVIYSKNPGMW